MISTVYQLKNKGDDVWNYFERDIRVPMVTTNGKYAITYGIFYKTEWI